jgi:hypothetical protein
MEPGISAVCLLAWLACITGLIFWCCPKARPESLFSSLFSRGDRLPRWLEMRVERDNNLATDHAQALRDEPPPPPPPYPQLEPDDHMIDMRDENGVLGPEHGGSGKATQAAYDDEDEGYTFNPEHPENGLQPQPPEPPRKKSRMTCWFRPVAKPVQAEPELTASERAELDSKFAAKKQAADEAKRARAALLESVVLKWALKQPVRHSVFGRKSREQLFQDALFLKVNAMIDAGAVLADFGDKPVQAPSYARGDEIVIRPMRADKEQEQAEAAPQEKEPKAARAGKKRGNYKSRSEDVKYLFWEIHRDRKHTTVKETVDYVNANLQTTFSAPLKLKTAESWGEYKQRPVATPAAEPVKRGPKKRSLPTGEFVPWNNKRVPVPVLMGLAGMLLALVSSGVPLTTSTALILAMGVFARHGITWQPKKSWAYRFMGRVGLTPRRGTRPARSLPADFAIVKHLYILRLVYLVATFAILPLFFFNLDETGVRFMPLKDRTWAPQGAIQVDISNLGDKRLFTAVPVVDAIGNLVYTQVIWQGKTTGSCPHAALQAEHQDVLAHTISATHWSTPTTMELLVDNLWNTYVKPKMIAMYMDVTTSYWAIAWDVYTSHRDPGLLARLRKKYPRLIILFVPATCTSELQPLDVGFNYDFKAFITALACAWLSLQVTKQLEAGVAPEQVQVPHKKSELVAPFCGWLASACRKMNSAEKIATTRRAWEKTGVLIAWDYSNPIRAALLDEAKAKHQEGSLFITHSARRSKAGKVPRTLLVVAGAMDMKEVVEPADEDGDEKVDEPDDCTVLEPAENVEAEEEGQEQEDEHEEEEQLPEPVLVDLRQTRSGRPIKQPAKYRE